MALHVHRCLPIIRAVARSVSMAPIARPISAFLLHVDRMVFALLVSTVTCAIARLVGMEPTVSVITARHHTARTAAHAMRLSMVTTVLVGLDGMAPTVRLRLIGVLARLALSVAHAFHLTPRFSVIVVLVNLVTIVRSLTARPPHV
jgi:hypothetical protein